MIGAGDGSWQMRGLQLGGALGARVTSQPTEADWDWASVIVLVKKAAVTFGPRAARSGRPVIWDALDFWRQPQENAWTEDQALAGLQDRIRQCRPTLVIGATDAQAQAAQGRCVPHHARVGLTAQPVRDRVAQVCYEGSERYLGAWRAPLERACADRGWRLVINPPNLAEADLIVAFRGGEWDGWMPRQWKSGVKIANALAAQRPLLTQPGAAASEYGVIGSVCDRIEDLESQLDYWTQLPMRQWAASACAARWAETTLGMAAARYREALASVLSPREAVA